MTAKAACIPIIRKKGTVRIEFPEARKRRTYITRKRYVLSSRSVYMAHRRIQLGIGGQHQDSQSPSFDKQGLPRELKQYRSIIPFPPDGPTDLCYEARPINMQYVLFQQRVTFFNLISQMEPLYYVENSMATRFRQWSLCDFNLMASQYGRATCTWQEKYKPGLSYSYFPSSSVKLESRDSLKEEHSFVSWYNSLKGVRSSTTDQLRQSVLMGGCKTQMQGWCHDFISGAAEPCEREDLRLVTKCNNVKW